MNYLNFKYLALAITLAFGPALNSQAKEAPAAAPKAVTYATAGEIICVPVKGKNPDEQVGPIVMGNMPVLQVFDLLRDISGRVVIPGESLPTLKLNFNSGGKLSRKDAIFALENILALNGVTLRLMENGFVRAILSKDPDNSGAPLIENIPEGVNSEQIYSKIFKLTYFDSGTAYNRLRTMISSKSRSAIVNQPEINSLIITDSLNNLKRMETIIDLLDQPSESRFELYSFPVNNGAASTLRSSLYQIFRTELNNRLRSSFVYADNRTNKLMIVTHPSNYEFFKKIIEEFDQPVAPFTTTEVIKIKEGNYWNIWGTIRGIVRHQQTQFARRGLRSEDRNNNDSEINRVTTAGEREAVENSIDSEAATVPAEVATANSDPGVVMTEDASPELQFSPYIFLYTDPSNMAFVVYGTKQDIARMQSLIDKLDIKSAPYVSSEVFDIKHARASDIRNVIEYTIVIQRRNFARAGIQSATENSQNEAAADGSEQQGFEYSNFVSTIADNRNNTILVQGTKQDIAQVQDLVDKLDVESAPLTSNEVIYLKHAEANTLARVAQNIINNQRNIFNRRRSRSVANNAGDASPESPEIGFEFSDYALVNADRRTNALFVYGTQHDIERIKSIINESDIPVEPMTTTEVFSLTHTDATQTASLISRVINGQQRSLRQVRSESRDVSNPAAQETQTADNLVTGIVEGQEALQFSSFISITPDRRSNSIIVYGTDTDIVQVKGLIGQIDIEVAPLTTSKVFLLENTQARSLYSVLNSVVRGQERALRQVRSSIREIRNVRPDDTNLTEAELSLESLQFSPYVTITPNDRNNSIIIYGTKSDIAQLESLIVISDIKIAPKTRSRTFFIRHADANDISTTLTNLIRQQQRVRERERTLTRVFRRGEQLQDENGDLIQSDAGGSSETDTNMLTETSTASYNDLFSFDEDLQFSPYLSIVADDRSNAVLAYGTSFDLEQVADLIDQIDKVLPQVKIEVVIAEVILSDDQISGLETFGISYNVTNPNQTSIGATSSTLDSSDTPGFDTNFSLNDFSLDAVFGLAKSNSNVKVLSAPTITTTHNRLASINVGESRPIITSSASNLNSSDLVTRSTIEFRDIGITLKVKPLVSENGFIQMDLEQVVETVIDTQTIDGNVQPIIGTRRASSFVSVRNEEVIVMGGLQAVDSTDKEGEVFALGKLPVFGSLFRPRSKNSTVRELIIFIRPRIVESSETVEQIAQDQLKSSSMNEDLESYFETGKFKDQEAMLKAGDTSAKGADVEIETPLEDQIPHTSSQIDEADTKELIPATRVKSAKVSNTRSATESAE
ncbi:secretin N-terminal domain-containing protein [Coraliomargarita sp. W4R53]